MKELLERLTTATGPSGYEDSVREIITQELKGYVDDVTVDALGSLIATKRGSGAGKRIMVSAHMDEIGFVATHIDDKGFIRFATVGGISEYVLLGQKVRFVNGTLGTFASEKLDDIKDLKMAKLFIDIGASSKDEAQALVRVGDFAGYAGSFRDLGSRVISKSLDDRAGCLVAIEAAKRLGQTDNEVYFVFSTQEEVGCRGAKTSAFALDPDIGIAVDVTRTGDTPNCRTMEVALGKGPAIKVKDSNLVAHPGVKAWMADTARGLGLAFQFEVLESGGTDAGPMSLSRGGVPSGTLSIPTRYIHTPAEMVDMGDIEGCVRLLVAMLSGPVAL